MANERITKRRELRKLESKRDDLQENVDKNRELLRNIKVQIKSLRGRK